MHGKKHAQNLVYGIMGTGSFPGIKRPERVEDHLPGFSAGVKKLKGFTYNHISGPDQACIGTALPFHFTYILLTERKADISFLLYLIEYQIFSKFSEVENFIYVTQLTHMQKKRM
jgi:hypothetical protein